MEFIKEFILEMIQYLKELIGLIKRPDFKAGQAVLVTPGLGSAKSHSIKVPAEWADSFTVRVWPTYQFFNLNDARGASPTLRVSIENADGGGSLTNQKVFDNFVGGKFTQGNANQVLWLKTAMVGECYRAQGSEVIVRVILDDAEGIVDEPRQVMIAINKGFPMMREKVETFVVNLSMTVPLNFHTGIPRNAKFFRFELVPPQSNTLGLTIANLGYFRFLGAGYQSDIDQTSLPYYAEWATSDSLGAIVETSLMTKPIAIPEKALLLYLTDSTLYPFGQAVEFKITWYIYE